MMVMEMQTHGETVKEDRSACFSFRHDIIRTLTDASKNKTVEYEKFLMQWRDLQLHDPESDNFLKVRLKALSQAVSFIKEREHDMLISYILGMSLWMHNLEVADALIECVINLATVNGGFVVRCLDMLVRNFIPPSSGLPTFIDFFSRRALMKGMPKETLTQWKTEHIGRKTDILERVHSAIARISELVPMTTLHLKPIVIQRMPHRIVDKEWNVLYMENMLRLAQDVQGEFIRNQMIMAVIDRLIEIDVEIRWEDIVSEDDSNKVFIFDMEFDEMLEENEEIAQGGPGSEAQQLPITLSNNGKKRQSLCAVADKMDVLMDMTLEHLKNYLDAGQIELVFDILMHSFQSTILDTFKSKFTQFLIFYICSVAPTMCGAKFAAILCDILTSASRAPNSRMSAAAYLASFLARAKYLPLAVISSSLKRVVDWCVAYTPRQVENKGAVDAVVHGVFYSACQAVMYVLSFRMRALLDDTHEREALRRLRMNDFVKHMLNPLKLCLPSVVEEFLKQATKAHLVDECLSKEVNRNIETVFSNSFGGINRLDMFFPFDPYLLKRSDRFIRPNFIFWSMVPSHDDEDDISDVELEVDDNELGSSARRADACSDMCMTPSSIPRSYTTVMETGSLSDKDIDDFEHSMNQMSLTRQLEFLNNVQQPIPLPAKLTPEYLLRFSMSLL